VPDSAWIQVIQQIPSVFEAVYAHYLSYRNSLNAFGYASRRVRLKLRQHYQSGPEAQALIAVAQLHLHYSESSVLCGHVVWRAMQVYHRYKNKLKPRGKNKTQ